VGMRVHASRMIDAQDVACTGSLDPGAVLLWFGPSYVASFARAERRRCR
jgi:hypothetical protein